MTNPMIKNNTSNDNISISNICVYKTTQSLPINIIEAWNFFSNPRNLSVITPPELDFRILTENMPKEIYEGMMIDYKVKPLFGLSVKWKTEITKVQKPYFFEDTQLEGPYRTWRHAHTFSHTGNATFMEDEVWYKLPLGVVGKIMNRILIRKRIENIFQYRRSIIQKLF